MMRENYPLYIQPIRQGKIKLKSLGATGDWTAEYYI